jgi:adenylate cyclase
MDAFSRAFSRKHTTPERRVGRTRIGVHSGSVIIGNVGGGNVFDYRALGDAINTTARLETVNRHINTKICVSAATAAQVPGFLGRPVGRLVLKGKSEPIEAFEALSPERAAQPHVALYREAFARLESGEACARESFAKIAEVDGLAQFHLERLQRGEMGTLVVMEEK